MKWVSVLQLLDKIVLNISNLEKSDAPFYCSKIEILSYHQCSPKSAPLQTEQS